jgi:archaellum component FlaF (FlaF/FlaG flagellin family)
MGFSVTATHVVFGIALLSAFSIASNVYWKNASYLEEARRDMDSRALQATHSNLSIVGAPAYDADADTYAFTIKNVGQYTLDITRFEYIVDGVISYDMSTGWPKVEGGAVTGTAFLLPGETLDVKLEGVASAPTHLKVTTEYGVGVAYS